MHKVANFLFDELLGQVNTADDTVAALKKILKEKPYTTEFLTELTNERWPEFDVDAIKFNRYDYHRSMSGAQMLCKTSWKVYDHVLLNPEVKLATKIQQCKSLMEMLDAGETVILKAILKKNLSEIYLNITYEKLNLALFGI